MRNLIKQRIGLLMILATLMVISLTTYLVLANKQKNDLEGVRADGATLTRILTNIPVDQLSTNQAYGGPLQLLKLYLSQSLLEYVVVEDMQGKVVNQLAMPNTVIPKVNFDKSSLWLSEEIIELPNKIIEYRAPLLNNDELIGHIRTGYQYPSTKIAFSDLSFFAQVALPIFLLMSFFYYLLTQQMKPVETVNNKINELLQKSNQVELGTTPELSNFIDNFNSFFTTVQMQSKELESIKIESQTTNNLLTYHKKRIETALQKLPDALLVLDEEGFVTFANDKLESTTGLMIEDVIGKSSHEWCQNTDLSNLLAQYNSNITPIHRIETIEYHPELMPDKTLSVSAYPLFSAKDSSVALGTLVIFRDISDVVQASKSRDSFISHVAHELKSPLNVIGMQSELIQDSGVNDENVIIQSSNIIIDEVERLSTLINDLLNITKIESGSIALNRQRVNTQEFFRDTFESAMRFSESKHINAEIYIDNKLSSLNLDKDLFRIALNNLFSNAVKYNSLNGKIIFSAELDNDFIIIKISDTGIGINKDEQEKVFDKFYRTSEAQSQSINGHGLGLALTKEIIMLHKGTIEIESELGAGTTFIITMENANTFLKEAI